MQLAKRRGVYTEYELNVLIRFSLFSSETSTEIAVSADDDLAAL